MNTERLKLSCGGEQLAIAVDWAEGSPPSVLSLHGGGPSSKESTKYLADALVASGRTVVRFDFSGQGQSTGEMKRSSLAKRITEARTVWRHFSPSGPDTLIGTSMGGYVAAALIPEWTVTNLILFCPAAYSSRARDLEFGSGFTEVIRQAHSFRETDLDAFLQSFRGNALLIRGTHDEVIPNEVVALYRQAWSHSTRSEEWIIEDCPHPIHRWAETRPEVQRRIVERVLQFLTAAL